MIEPQSHRPTSKGLFANAIFGSGPATNRPYAGFIRSMPAPCRLALRRPRAGGSTTDSYKDAERDSAARATLANETWMIEPQSHRPKSKGLC